MSVGEEFAEFRCKVQDEYYGTTGFGLAAVAIEGSPRHPEELEWSCRRLPGCKKCSQRYKLQLERYNTYHGIQQ